MEKYIFQNEKCLVDEKVCPKFLIIPIEFFIYIIPKAKNKFLDQHYFTSLNIGKNISVNNT